MPTNVIESFEKEEVTGRQLLSFDKGNLKTLGAGHFVALFLLGEIKNYKTRDQVIFMDYDPYCFEKLLDFLRMKSAHLKQLVDKEPALPVVRDSKHDTFMAVVSYLFPSECSKLILG